MKAMLNWWRERFPFDPDDLQKFGSEPVPNHLKHWWWCLGGTPAYLFLVQMITGILLTFYYVPSPDHAYESIQHINDSVAFGWYIRSLHHWCSHFMIIAVVLHMIRVFFTGAYRKPRELNWMVGFCLLGLTLVFGFTGYSLVYEQLSYWGATVAGNLTESVPLVGTLLADFIRGGPKVGAPTLTRFYVFHVGILPSLLLLLMVFHLTMVRLLGVTEFTFKGEDNKGKRTFAFFPDHFLTEMAIGVTLMFVLTFFAIVFPAGLAEKANPLVTPAAIKPEWYFYFTFRWLKLTSLTFAVLSLGFAAFLAILWPLVDNAITRRFKASEVSIFVGFIVFLGVIILTIWEAIVLHYGH